MEYHATSDKPTHVNLSQHSYFNLSGGDRNILDHRLTIEHGPVPRRSTRRSSRQASCGRWPGRRSISRKPTAIGARIEKHVQLLRGRGYDHNFVLLKPKTAPSCPKPRGSSIQSRAGPSTSRRPSRECSSIPRNFLAPSKARRSRVYAQRWGLCLGDPALPDSPNRPNFPSTILRPGVEYRSHF